MLGLRSQCVFSFYFHSAYEKPACHHQKPAYRDHMMHSFTSSWICHSLFLLPEFFLHSQSAFFGKLPSASTPEPLRVSLCVIGTSCSVRGFFAVGHFAVKKKSQFRFSQVRSNQVSQVVFGQVFFLRRTVPRRKILEPFTTLYRRPYKIFDVFVWEHAYYFIILIKKYMLI